MINVFRQCLGRETLFNFAQIITEEKPCALEMIVAESIHVWVIAVWVISETRL